MHGTRHPYRQFVFAFFALFVVGQFARSQDKVIELKTADSLLGKRFGNEEVRELVGNVHMVQTSASGEVVKLWCDRALRYMTQNKVELFGRVRVERDSTKLRAAEGVYWGDDKRAVMRRKVRLERGSMTLTSNAGEYFSELKRAHFTGDVVVIDSASVTTCEKLTYFEDDERSIAVGNVKVVNSERAMTVYGDSLVRYGKIGYTIVPKNPRLVEVDSTESAAVDTLVVVSQTMEAFRDPYDRFIATDSVLIARSDLSARAGRATYYASGDSMILERQPIVWYDVSQVSGDSIVVSLEDRKLRSVYVNGRAMAISQTDTTHTNRFDQLTGRELTMYFEGQKLEHIDVERNATSLYYLFDDERPNGANRASGDRIRIDFIDGQVNDITIVGGVQGQFYPENMIANREHQYNLDGFRWIENRPRRQNLSIVQ
ncbi:MAG: hypothetical protein L0Y80_00620 [Ignavibacteriae bacterium]|nr:hypothetical protein [Ignavibacteriota bacterium]